MSYTCERRELVWPMLTESELTIIELMAINSALAAEVAAMNYIKRVSTTNSGR